MNIATKVEETLCCPHLKKLGNFSYAMATYHYTIVKLLVICGISSPKAIKVEVLGGNPFIL